MSRSRLLCGLVAGALLGPLAAPAAAPAKGPTGQPELSTRSAPILTIDGLRFRDLDRNGELTPYEDWRSDPEHRADDLLRRMTLVQKAGLLVHGTLPSTETGYDAAQVGSLVGKRHIRTFITRLSVAPDALATANNTVQEAAEKTPLGVPVLISTDPRNSFTVTEGQTVAGVGTTAMPDAIGWAATGNNEMTRRLADIARQEYRAVGIGEGLSPQADLATEPRWTRVNGTFGSDPQTARRFVRAYVAGMQNGTAGLDATSVATVTKHWVGYGAQDNGYDSHYYYGRSATFPGGRFADHVVPFLGAFEMTGSGIMPTYSILRNLTVRGHKVEQVGAGFNSFLLTDLLRGRYGFQGVILSDWAITGDCPQACKNNRPPAFFVGPWGVGMPWGVENLTVVQRFARAINAGVDQIGGSDEPVNVTQAVNAGLVSTARVDQAARRVLAQTFRLGLFENPFVDPSAAKQLSGNAEFQALGDRAQAASLTLLTNRRNVLPARAGQTVYLSGVSADVARELGLKVTTDPRKASLAIVRLADPRSGSGTLGLGFTGAEADYRAFRTAVAAGVPTVAVPKLDRPLVLTNVADRAAAVLANYGVSDRVLLETVLGTRVPGGRLPFELPSSQAAADKQLEDVPDDSTKPLFDRGDGLSYRR
ncbi:glycoside hydrolase family 3 protein [Cryptosporangium sp. NPDC048952]|uniref:glycoside hydrolase family 3 protein n=1 Tax=Cryptosporangium sp. NPDC048952 TaxID=3363961 RepID=UPI00371C6254